MKKLVIAGTAVLALALTGCGASSGYNGNNGGLDYGGYSSNGGWSDRDWDMNYGSVYNNNTYCSGGTYNPMPNNQYTCNRNGIMSAPVVRPPVVIPPKSAQKPPADVLKRVEQQKADQQRNLQQKAEKQRIADQQKKAPAQNKAPAPAPKAPAPKTGK